MEQPMRSDRLANHYAEAAVLGSMILDGRVVPAVLERLSREDFTDPRHAVLFDAILRVWRQAGKDLDGVLVRAELDRTGQLQGAGGLEYVGKCLETVPSAANAVYYRDLVVEASRQRRLHKTLEAMRLALDESGDSIEAGEKVRALALGIEDAQTRRTVFTAADYALLACLEIQNEGAGLETGFKAIDDILGGFQPGELVILAARPSVGKTSLATAIAGHIAKTTRVLFCTLEVPARRIFWNLEGMVGKVNVHKLQRHPDNGDMDRFQTAACEVSKTGLIVVEGCGTVDRVAAVVRQFKQEGSLGLVVVDYLGLLKPATKTRTRYEDVTEISRSLKVLALGENIPILCCAQLNRAVEGREGHRPRISDLRDSGSIEQDADTILMIHRQDVTRKHSDWQDAEIDGTAEVAIHKSRNGPTGIARLVFIEEFMLFGDRCMGEEPEPRTCRDYSGEKDDY